MTVQGYEPGKTYKTRSGGEARIISVENWTSQSIGTFGKPFPYLIGMLNGVRYTWDVDGSRTPAGESPDDLLPLKPKVRTGARHSISGPAPKPRPRGSRRTAGV